MDPRKVFDPHAFKGEKVNALLQGTLFKALVTQVLLPSSSVGWILESLCRRGVTATVVTEGDAPSAFAQRVT